LPSSSAAGPGWAHIGVLRELEATGIAIEALAGTSIGGVVSIAFASDRLEILEDLAYSASSMRSMRSMRSMLRYLSPNWQPGSVLSGNAIAKLVEEHLGDLTFESLSIPTAVIAADLVSGEAVVLNSGPVGDAIHATIAPPGIFQPIVRNGQILSDGGAVMPVPVVPARTTAALMTLSVVRCATGLMLSKLARLSLDCDPPDFELQLPVGHVDTSNFTRAECLIEIGRRSTAKALFEIERLIQA